MMTETINTWRRQEVREVPPFGTSDAALADCRFAPDEGKDVDEVETTYLDRERLHDGLRPRFRLAVNLRALLPDTGVDAKDARLIVSARDFATKEYRVLGSWPCDAVPKEEWNPVDDSAAALCSNEGFLFAIIISLAQNRESSVELPHRAGSVLAQRWFEVKAETDSLGFPMKFVDFAGSEWPAGTLWAVRYLQEEDDFDRPLSEVLELQINRTVEVKLRQAARAPAGGLLMQALATEVYAEVATRVLSWEPDEPSDDDQGLRAQVVRNLEGVKGEGEDELRRIAKEQPEQLRARVQELFGVVNSIVNLDLRRLPR